MVQFCMRERTVICPGCNEPAVCVPANYISVSMKDAETMAAVKHIQLRDVKNRYIHNPDLFVVRYYAVHYPFIDPALENLTDLPKKYSADRWSSKFKDIRSQETSETVIRCGACNYLARHALVWPNDAYFKVGHKGKTLWAYDRDMALKILKYIESKSRAKRILANDEFGKDDYDFIVQDYHLRKLPEFFQTAKARPEISKKLRRLLGLPAVSI